MLFRSMIEDTRLVRVLGAFRHLPAVDSEAIANALLRVSEMVCELPQIESLEIDPLVADEHGVLAQGVRIQLRAQATAGRRYSHMAIHPYPSALERNIRLADGTPLILRPIRPEDADNELAFVSGLSEHSRYMRFMNALRELSPAMLARFTQIDYDRDMALVVLTAQIGRAHV